MTLEPSMLRTLALCLLATAALAAAGCTDPPVADACAKAAECGADEGGCVSARQAQLGELSGRCGEAVDEAFAVYTCQGKLACDARDTASYEAACADELQAFTDVTVGGAGGCPDAPRPIAP